MIQRLSELSDHLQEALVQAALQTATETPHEVEVEACDDADSPVIIATLLIPVAAPNRQPAA